MKLHLPELHYNLGHVLHQQGDLVQSAQSYRQAITLDPTFAQAHHSLAVVLGEQGDYETAISHYRQVINLQPDAVKAYNNLGCLLVEQGRIAEALRMYRRGLALAPSATLQINFGKAIAAKDPIAAITAYRRAVAIEPHSSSAQYNLGQALQQQGQYQAAIVCFQAVLQQDASNPMAHTACGLAYMALGQLDQGLAHFRQALQPQQAHITAFCEWAEERQGTDDLALARKTCSQFLQTLLQPTQPEPTTNQQWRQWISPLRSADTSAGKSATAIDSGMDTKVQHLLAQTYLHLGNVLTQYGGIKQCQQAEIYYQKALQIRSQDLEIYLRLGNCLEQQQRWNAAAILYRLALTLYPNTPQLYQNLGQLLERQQRWAEAISYYRQALQMVETEGAQPTVVLCNQQSGCLSESSTSGFSGFYSSTQDWMIQNQSGWYLALQPDTEDHLIPETETSVHCALPGIVKDPAVQNSTNLTPIDSNCDGLNCERCLKRIVQQFVPRHLGHGVYACRFAASSTTAQSTTQTFVAEIPQAQAWMIPSQSAWMITNSITVLSPDHAVLLDISREYPGELPGCCQPDARRFQQIQEIWLATQFNPDLSNPVEQIAGRVAVLAGLSGHNYFHWMVDILPRFALLQQSGIELADIDWFWINNPQQHFQQETLNQLGIPAEKILVGDHHPRIQAEQLLVPSFAGNLGWIEPWALKFLRQRFLGLADSHLPRYERIYISRSNAHHRRVLNEAAVLEKLSAVGFVSIELETLTLAEQIALFRDAKVIVAPHGGGLTNLVFCSPETQVVELMTPQYIRHYYWVISQQLGLRHFFVMGAEIGCAPIQRLMYPSPLMEDIWVNLPALDMVLQQLELG